jgi:hypothetical protein
VVFPKGLHQIEVIDGEGSRSPYAMGRGGGFFDNGPQVCDEFMSERDQPPVTEREPL